MDMTATQEAMIDARSPRHRIDDLVGHLGPRETTMLRVLETKAAAGETAISVTSAAMRAAGGAAFSSTPPSSACSAMPMLGLIMAPTADVLRDFIGKAVLGMELF